jgi:hypothetical protein
MKTNAGLQRDVLEELPLDPSVNATNVQVTVDHVSNHIRLKTGRHGW